MPISSDAGTSAPRSAGAAASRHMMRIHLLMSAGITVSALAAQLIASNAALHGILFTTYGLTGAGWAVLLAPLLLVMTVSTRVRRISVDTARELFVLHAVLMGLSLGTVTYVATGQSLGPTLLAAAGAFGLLAMLGWASCADFSPFGTFLTLALFALVLLLALNLAFTAKPLDILLSGGAIVLFAALTGFDVPRLRRLHRDGDVKTASVGALTLYLDFVNMFLSLLRFTGRARR